MEVKTTPTKISVRQGENLGEKLKSLGEKSENLGEKSQNLGEKFPTPDGTQKQ